MDADLSRRTLLGMGMAGAAVSVLPAAAQRTPALITGDRVGFAVVGIGKLSQGQIIPALRKTKVAKLTALVSGDPGAHGFAAKEGIAPSSVYNYADFDRIVSNPAIDVVYIVLPNSMHAEYTIRAFKAGKHVLCEKPMATTIADAERMIAAAKAANRQLMIAYRCHYEPHNLEAMRRIRSRRYGPPKMIITNMLRQSSLDDPSDKWRLDMAMSGGGALADMGIYGINGARYLSGEEPVEVRAWETTNRGDPRFRTVPDQIAWQFRFPSGAVANNATSFSSGPGTMSWDVYCENGRLRGDPGCFYGGNHLDIMGGPDQGPVAIGDIDQFGREMDWMADVVRGRKPMVSPGEEGLQDMRLIRAILDSCSRGGATVKTDFGYRRAVDPAAVVSVA